MGKHLLQVKPNIWPHISVDPLFALSHVPISEVDLLVC